MKTESKEIKTPPLILSTGQAPIARTVALISAAFPLRRIVLITTLAVTLSLLGSTAYAATHYVRPGATGANNGNDWNNAWASIPATLTRGDTYYLADGSYGGYTFDDAASGSTYIYIKKATVADHGTETGWHPTMGDGQAIFTSMWFGGAPGNNCGYYDLNGYSVAGTKNCGIKITFGNGECGVTFPNACGKYPYCAFRYMEMAGPAGATDYPYLTTPDTQGIFVNGYTAGDDTSHMLVSHCYIHGVATGMQDPTYNCNNYLTVEYCEFSDIRSSNVNNHNNIIWLGSSYSVFRYNLSHNYAAEGVFMGWSPSCSHTGVEIYGNVFYDGVYSARGIEFRESDNSTPAPFTNIKIYNNTFQDMPMAAVRVMSNCKTTGCEIKNNLLGSNGISLENGGSGITQANNIANATSKFMSIANRDFHLASATTSGTILSSPYNSDRDGVMRGTDGIWDIGAYEYGSGSVSTNAMISVLPNPLDFGSVKVGVTSNLTLTVQNTGGGTLSGTANVQAPFSIIAGGTYNLGANQSQSVTVRFSPTSVGSTNQAVTFTGGAGETTIVRGVGAEAASTNAIIAVSPGSLDFSFVTVGATSDLMFTVRNTGGSTLSGTASVPAPFSIMAGGTYNLGANQSQSVNVRFSPKAVGSTNQTVTFTGGGGATAIASGVAVSAPIPGSLAFEAEAGTLTSPFAVSGGYIYQASETGVTDGGRAVYNFTITNAGDYTIEAEVNAPSEAQNSLFVNIDAEPQDPSMVWHIPITTGFESRLVNAQGNGTYDNPQFVPKYFSLTAGSHQLIIRGREANTQLDRLQLVKRLSPPSNLAKLGP